MEKSAECLDGLRMRSRAGSMATFGQSSTLPDTRVHELNGHQGAIRAVRFNSKRVVPGFRGGGGTTFWLFFLIKKEAGSTAWRVAPTKPSAYGTPTKGWA